MYNVRTSFYLYISSRTSLLVYGMLYQTQPTTLNIQRVFENILTHISVVTNTRNADKFRLTVICISHTQLVLMEFISYSGLRTAVC